MVNFTRTSSLISKTGSAKKDKKNKASLVTTNTPTMNENVDHERQTNNNTTPSKAEGVIRTNSNIKPSRSPSFLKEITTSLESMLGTTRAASTSTTTAQRREATSNNDREGYNSDDDNSSGFEVLVETNHVIETDSKEIDNDVIHEVVGPINENDCTNDNNGEHVISLPDGSVVVTEKDIDILVEEEQKWERQHSSRRLLVTGGSSLPGTSLPSPGTTPHGVKSLYGQPKSADEVSQIIGNLPARINNDSNKADGAGSNDNDRRIKYHARLIPDDRKVQDRLIRRNALDPKNIFTTTSDNDSSKREIKPRRGPLPAVFVSDFMKSLVVIESPVGRDSATTKKRWIFSGVLNGWPGLQTLELISITCRIADKVSNMLDNDKTNLFRKQMMRHRLVRLWHTDKEGFQNIPPHIHSDILLCGNKGNSAVRELRVTLRAPEYTTEGYTLNNPGHVIWYEAARSKDRVLLGENIVQTMKQEMMLSDNDNDGNSQCTNLHLISHRYATGGNRREMPRDMLVYHSIVLLEWDHGRYVTVIESAYLHGLSGVAGKSNWYHDKYEPMTKLYKAFHPLMICPWESSRMEIRCNDLPHCKNLNEFKQYIEQYTGPTKRFLDPNYTCSSQCRITFNTKQHIAQYLCNYIRRNTDYSELNRNCQTFAADFYGFMAGKKNIQPFHPINRVDYQNRSHTFLYNPDMFQ